MFMIFFIAMSIGTVSAIAIDCDGKFTLNGIKLYRENTKCQTVEECLKKYRP